MCKITDRLATAEFCCQWPAFCIKWQSGKKREAKKLRDIWQNRVQFTPWILRIIKRGMRRNLMKNTKWIFAEEQ